MIHPINKVACTQDTLFPQVSLLIVAVTGFLVLERSMIDSAGAAHRQYLTSVNFTADMVTFSNLNLNYLLNLHLNNVGDRFGQPLQGALDALRVFVLQRLVVA